MPYQLIDTVTPDVGAKAGADKINNNAIQAQYQGGYFTVGGTANAITLTSATGAPSGYATGQEFCFRANATNTGVTTVNVDGLGIKTIKTLSGADLPSGYLSTSVDTCLRYDGVNMVANVSAGALEDQVPTNSILASKGANYGKNLITNADFSVNQEGVSGTVSLAAGEYGHDMFKAGAGGCTYTFATSSGVTTITITAGTLLQIIEGQTLPSKTVVLAWEGTAQGRIGSGSYGSSGSVTDTLTGGVNVTVEFNSGTLAKPQLEFGNTATGFEYISPADQLARCLRYFEILGKGSGATFIGVGHAENTTDAAIPINFSEKRATPSLSVTSATGFSLAKQGFPLPNTNITFDSISGNKSARVLVTVDPGLTAGDCVSVYSTNGSAHISIDSRL